MVMWHVRIHYTLSKISKFSSEKMPLKKERKRGKDAKSGKKALATKDATRNVLPTCRFKSMHSSTLI